MSRRPVEVRCTAPHPSHPGRECRAKLADVIPGSVEVRGAGDLGPGCTKLRCPRCRSVYVVCPVYRAA